MPALEIPKRAPWLLDQFEFDDSIAIFVPSFMSAGLGFQRL